MSKRIRIFFTENWFNVLIFLILAGLIILNIFIFASTIDLVTIATFFLALAAFFGILQNGNFIKQTKELADRERKDRYLPILRVAMAQITEGDGGMYLLAVNVWNDGNGPATYTGFEIPDGYKAPYLATGGDGGKSKVVPSKKIETIIIRGIFGKGLEEIERYHQKELKLKFIDVFKRDITLTCELFVKEEKGKKIIYTKTSTSCMSLPN